MTFTEFRRSAYLGRLLLLLCFAAACIGQASTGWASDPDAGESELTIDRIFHGSDFRAASASVRWLPATGTYSRLEPSASDKQQIRQYSLDSDDGTPLVPTERLVPPGTDQPLQVEDYAFSVDNSLLLVYTNSKRVWRRNTRGDYWVLDRSSHDLHQIGGNAPSASLMFAKLSPTSPQVAYVRDRNIYVEDLRSHAIRQVTHTKSSHIINGTFDWVYEEELALRDGFRWSPNGTMIAYWQLDTTGVPQFPLVNNTDHLYPRIQMFAYPKVGQQNSACRVGVLDVAQGTTRWLAVPGDARDHYIARMQWIDDQTILLQQLNRRQNTNRILIADLQTDTVATLLTERDEAWVDVHDELFWLADKQTFTWISERDGWRHVYLIDRQTGQATLVTPGDYDVIELLHVDELNHQLYFLASPDNACQKYLYSVQLDGSNMKRLSPTDQPGTWQYHISPDGKAAVATFSSANDPPRSDLISLPEHKTLRTLEDNSKLRKLFEKLDRVDMEFFRVDIGDGVQLDAWCVRPPKMKNNKKYPLLVHVYGEPAGQTVLDRWGGDNFLWHLMLAQKGYVVMSFDNRGTPAPRGRDWRKCVYKQVGVLAPEDQAAAVQAVLQQRDYLDPERVGVWGWSGGGSMTLNALFKFPELYKTGISIAPVPNQRYYDSIYQERYMGLPEDNVDGYVQGSAINFADQLQGNLMLIHGTGDDNCHFQTMEKLINELIRCDKQFAMLAYPNRTHSIREGTNTTRHLRWLMTNYLLSHLPPGPH